MQTNEHIFSAIDCAFTIKHYVRSLPESAEKKMMLKLLDECSDHLIAVQMDYAAAKQKLAELTKSIYAPVISAQTRYPEEGNYNAVREYVESRKDQDEPFKIYCQTHSRRQLCDRLSDEFGWVVDVKSFGRNIQRH